MGLVGAFFNLMFGGGRNVVKDTVEVFYENAEAAAGREASYRNAALGQFAAEFVVERKGGFDRFMDGLNRVPRPALALGTLGLFISAMIDPIWFASRMQGIALVPQPLWWLLGAIVSFYFGARHQIKGQEFQRSIAQTLARASDVTANLAALQNLETGVGVGTGAGVGTGVGASPNAALDDWRSGT